MSEKLSRREALSKMGGILLGGLPLPSTLNAKPPKQPAEATIVDTHVHVVDSRLPGGLDVKTPLAPFEKGDAEGPKRLVKTFEEETKKAGVGHALCMPRLEVSDKDPLGIQEILALSEVVRGVKLHPVGLAHPERFDRDHLDKVEAVLKQGKVKALKAYLGYLYYEPSNPAYRLYFKLAAKYNIPMIFHCGDTNSRKAKVKYAHPLKIDEIAVDFPKTKFVIAHFGNPWVLDAAQVVYKNENVWVDLSAILIGDAAAFAQKKKDGTLEHEAKRIRDAIEYTESPEKFMFGSDWPLTPMSPYRDFIAQLFPKKHHAAVFGGTAKKLFGL